MQFWTELSLKVTQNLGVFELNPETDKRELIYSEGVFPRHMEWPMKSLEARVSLEY